MGGKREWVMCIYVLHIGVCCVHAYRSVCVCASVCVYVCVSVCVCVCVCVVVSE